MSELNDAVIEEYAKAIKLPALRRECDQLARQARADSWSYEEYLRELLDAEVRAGEASTTARRLRGCAGEGHRKGEHLSPCRRAREETTGPSGRAAVSSTD